MMPWYSVVVTRDDGGDQDGEIFSETISAQDETEALEKAARLLAGE